MKKIIYISIILLLANSSHSQTKLTYEQVSNPDNRIRTNDLTEYVSKNGEVFKVGETLTIGNPSGNLDTYNFIDNYDAFGTSYKVTLQNKGFDSEIIKFRTSGN